MASVALPNELTAAQLVVADEIRAARGGRLPDLFRMLLHSPDVARGWLGLGTAIRYQTSLDDGVRELLICYVAQMQRCPSEVATHTPLAVAAGVPADALRALGAWRSSSLLLTDEQRVALVLAERAVVGTPPDDNCLADALEAFGEQGVLEVLALVAYYTAIALFLNSAGVAAPSTPG